MSLKLEVLSVAVKAVILLLEIATSWHCVWVFGIFSVIGQSNVKRSLYVSEVLFMTWCAFHQVNNVLTFTVDFMIDFKVSFCLLIDKYRC